MSELKLYLVYPGLGKTFFVENSQVPVIELPIGAIKELIPRFSRFFPQLTQVSFPKILNDFYSLFFKYIKQGPEPSYLLLCPAKPYLYDMFLNRDNMLNFPILIPENTPEIKEEFMERYKSREIHNYESHNQVFSTEDLNQLIEKYQASWDSDLIFFREKAKKNKNIIFTKAGEYLTDYIDITTGQPTELFQQRLAERKNQE